MFAKGLYLFQNPRNSKLKFRETLDNIHRLATEVYHAEKSKTE